MNGTAHYNRRLALLKAEVGNAFPNLLHELEEGRSVVLINGEQLDRMHDREGLRLIGAIVIVCQHYGAAAIFLKSRRYAWFNVRAFDPGVDIA